MIPLSVPQMSRGACRASVEKVPGPLAAPLAPGTDLAAGPVSLDGPADAGQMIAALTRIALAARPV
ncbi:MAG: hypothetical protein IOC80_00515 [Rhodobacter sp.]|nr:hypothetical protein [Rhodobacter sp.]MCA3523203.1 hypothetical protein [Rhodobacter sp.]MCA3524817.1 hypothetical protein [Rhodobacter sp.]MCA3528575.1 hypothetical protein [Rhodobacter sp.]MCA3533108.1 hypothetical protein [Rhodobacter sp.]